METRQFDWAAPRHDRERPDRALAGGEPISCVGYLTSVRRALVARLCSESCRANRLMTDTVIAV